MKRGDSEFHNCSNCWASFSLPFENQEKMWVTSISWIFMKNVKLWHKHTILQRIFEKYSENYASSTQAFTIGPLSASLRIPFCLKFDETIFRFLSVLNVSSWKPIESTLYNRILVRPLPIGWEEPKTGAKSKLSNVCKSEIYQKLYYAVSRLLNAIFMFEPKNIPKWGQQEKLIMQESII